MSPSSEHLCQEEMRRWVPEWSCSVGAMQVLGQPLPCPTGRMLMSISFFQRCARAGARGQLLLAGWSEIKVFLLPHPKELHETILTALPQFCRNFALLTTTELQFSGLYIINIAQLMKNFAKGKEKCALFTADFPLLEGKTVGTSWIQLCVFRVLSV